LPGRRVILLALASGALALPGIGAAAGPPALLTPQGPPTPAPAFVSGKVIVEWAPGAERGDKTAAREEAEVTYESNLGAPSFQLVQVEAGQSVGDAIEELEGDPAVAVAERDGYATPSSIPNDPLFGDQWALQNTGVGINGESAVAGDDIDVPPAWDRTIGSPSIVVADIDTGYRYDSPDLGPVGLPGHDFVGNDSEAPTEDENPTDEDQVSGGHGVHTAGIIGAAGGNGIGITGVAQDIRIMPLRVCSNAPAVDEPRCPTSALIAAINYAGAHGVRVANLSLGGTSSSEAELDAFADNPGTLYVIAAGNTATDNDLVPDYPCDYEPTTTAITGATENIICVAATDQADKLAGFSDYGADSVDLGAPGTQILSTYPASETNFEDTFETNDFATRWTATGVNGGFERTAEAPLTSFGITDSAGAPPAPGSGRSSTLSAPVAVPASDGSCTFSGLDSVALGGGAFNLIIFKNGTSDWTFSLPETSGARMESFSTVPIGDLAGSTVGVRVRYVAGSSPSANSGVWLDDLTLSCREPLSTPPGYALLSGTSMATPMVSGAAALLYSEKPSASVAEVSYALLEGVDPDPSLAGRTVTGGRLEVARALDWLSPPAPVISTDPASPAADDAPRIVGSVEAGTQVKVFASAGCQGAAVATGTPAQLESTGLTVSVPTGTSKAFSALVETRYSGSPCSAPVSFTDPAPVNGPTTSVPLEEVRPSQSAPTISHPASRGPSCRVPKLAGKTLAKAEAALKGAHCGLGRVTQPKGRSKAKAAVLLVAASSPAAGAKTAGSVSLRLAPRHAKRHR
jgi:thermitase